MPATDFIFGVTPQQITQQALIRYLNGSLDIQDLVDFI